MTGRDLYQLVSIGISVYCLVLIGRKVRRRPMTFGVWMPMITIMALTVGFYLLVQLDLLGVASSEWSAVRSLAIQIALLIYVWQMPPEHTP